ncbi:hypothetical protein NE237_000135 [Protea cynaroides]|uniref:Uncharacterized protein n=1 Tax=Protea cynaroides TaxID=273540 RepID=A0A9Q0GP85_9MAGN|nr:hypothetical protein NE237_000135 [Protea cynaroides]
MFRQRDRVREHVLGARSGSGSMFSERDRGPGACSRSEIGIRDHTVTGNILICYRRRIREQDPGAESTFRIREQDPRSGSGSRIRDQDQVPGVGLGIRLREQEQGSGSGSGMRDLGAGSGWESGAEIWERDPGAGSRSGIEIWERGIWEWELYI